MNALNGKKGLVVGIANEHSLAYGCARHFRVAGADLALTYLNAKTERYVSPLASALGSQITRPCDVSVDGQLDAVFEEIATKWGRLDFALHSVGYPRAEDLHGRIIDCSAEGFAFAMQVSVHSFLRMAKLAEPLMASDGCLLAMSYYGADKAVRELQYHGPRQGGARSRDSIYGGGTRPQGYSCERAFPGPVATRSASGVDHFDELLERAARQAPEHRLVTLDDVGALAAFLVSDAAKAITGNIAYVDAGYHVLG